MMKIIIEGIVYINLKIKQDKFRHIFLRVFQKKKDYVKKNK